MATIRIQLKDALQAPMERSSEVMRAGTSARIRDVEVNGVHLRIKDFRTSVLTDIVAAELQDDAYNIERIRFGPAISLLTSARMLAWCRFT